VYVIAPIDGPIQTSALILA